MGLKVGDPIFDNKGRPGVVVDRDEASASLRVDDSSEKVTQNRRHGYLSGLDMDLRTQFNGIMDDVLAIEEPKSKLEHLQAKIQQMGSEEPTPQSARLLRYLKSELFHIMNTYQVFPKQYNIAFDKADR